MFKQKPGYLVTMHNTVIVYCIEKGENVHNYHSIYSIKARHILCNKPTILEECNALLACWEECSVCYIHML